MRVAVVAESFLPAVNGVSGSVVRVLDHLRATGHTATVVCCGGTSAAGAAPPAVVSGACVVPVPSLPLPRHRDVRVAVPLAHRLDAVLDAVDPDVVHLASPFALGGAAVRAAGRRGVPVVAVYQTDVAGFAGRYGLGAASAAAWRVVTALHSRAALTLAPTPTVAADLELRGVPRVAVWPRGVDAALFHPGRRDAALRRRLAPGGEVLVGYMGRLAPEKRLEDLAVLRDLPGVRLVLVGDGPERAALQRALPGAALTGALRGPELARAVASLDVFVHPGQHETFCQAAQEAMACGVPVVAPAAGGLLDLVAPGVTGLLHRPGDLAALRADVARLADDAALRDRLGRAARAAVEGRTWERVCAELVDHYRAVLAPVRA